MVKRINYKAPARLTWMDISKMTSGIGYLRGAPHFEGTLAEAVRHVHKLDPANRLFARIETEPQAGFDNKNILDVSDIQAIERRADFPRT